MNSTCHPSYRRWIYQIAFLGVVGTAIMFSGFGIAFAQKGKTEGSQDERAQDLAKLKQIFTGQMIDLYFTPDELADNKPRMKDAKFVDLAIITGKPLLQVEQKGDTWLVDPDTVFIYRLHKK